MNTKFYMHYVNNLNPFQQAHTKIKVLILANGYN